MKWQSDKWIPHSAAFSAAPKLALLSRQPDHLDGFVVALDGSVHITWKNDADAEWTPLHPLPGNLFMPETPIAVLSRDENAIELFVVDTAGILQTCSWTVTTGWSAWRPHPGATARAGAGVSAVSLGPREFHVFMVGTDGRVRLARGEGNAGLGAASNPLGNWTMLEAPPLDPAAPLCAVSLNSDTIALFAVDSRGGMRTARWNRSGGWSTWSSIEGAAFPTTAGPAAVSRTAEFIDLFAVDAGGNLRGTSWHASENGPTQWTPWFDFRGARFPAGQRVVATSRAPDALEVFAVDTTGALCSSWWRGNFFHNGQRWSPLFPITEGRRDAVRGFAAVARRARNEGDLFMAKRGSEFFARHSPALVPWSGQNFSKNVSLSTYRFEEPATTDEIMNVVREAESQGKRVRAIGTGWSAGDALHSDDVIVSLSKNMNSLLGLWQGGRTFHGRSPAAAAVTPEASTLRLAHVEAGMAVWMLNLALDKVALLDPTDAPRPRWALPTMGGAGGQTIAGLLATSSHGGTFSRRPLADFVRAIELVGPGGHGYWIESSARPITRAGMMEEQLPRHVVIQDSSIFRAALISAGAMGIIVSLVLEVDDQAGISQRVLRTTWNQVRPLLQLSNSPDNAFFGATAPLGISHPATLRDGTAALARSTDIEIFLNPYRIDDNYAGGSRDRNCWIISKATAGPLLFDDFANKQEAFNEPPSDWDRFWHDAGEAFKVIADPVGAILNAVSDGLLAPHFHLDKNINAVLHGQFLDGAIDPFLRKVIEKMTAHGLVDAPASFQAAAEQIVELTRAQTGGPGTVKDVITRIIDRLRKNNRGYAPRYQTLDTYDYQVGSGGGNERVLYTEAVITTQDDRHLGLLDALLAEFDRLIQTGVGTYLGAWAIRFTDYSNAYLATQRPPCEFQNYQTTREAFDAAERARDPRAGRPRVCHIEFFALKEHHFINPVHDGNMEGVSDEFMKRFERMTLAAGGRMHWGQLNHMSPRRVQAALGPDLSAWRRTRTTLSRPSGSRGNHLLALRPGLSPSTTFSNALSERCGLEMGSQHVALARVGGRALAFTYDTAGTLLAVDLDSPGSVQRIVPPDGQRFVGELCATALGSTAHITGWGLGNQLLRAEIEGGTTTWSVLNDRVALQAVPALRAALGAPEPTTCVLGGKLQMFFKSTTRDYPIESTSRRSDLVWLSLINGKWDRGDPLVIDPHPNGPIVNGTHELTSLAIDPDRVLLVGLTVGSTPNNTPMVAIMVKTGLQTPRARLVSFTGPFNAVRFDDLSMGRMALCRHRDSSNRETIDLIAPLTDGGLLVAALTSVDALFEEGFKPSLRGENQGFPQSTRQKWMRPPGWFEQRDIQEQYVLRTVDWPRERFVGGISAAQRPDGGYDVVGRGINGALLRATKSPRGEFTWASLGEVFGPW